MRFTRWSSCALLLFAAGCAHHAGSASAPVQGTPSAPPAETGDLPIAPDSIAKTMLVDVQSLDSTIRVELRYATANNFTGAPLPGYEGNHALLREQAAVALARVQQSLAADGLSLQVYDAYRPVRASVGMVEWTDRVHRSDLIRDGYIASRSRHNLGLAIDLTLVDRATGLPLDMGTPFDTFSADAHTANATGKAAQNRALLRRAMEAQGFINYDQEWWHYTYVLPNPVRFDLVIR